MSDDQKPNIPPGPFWPFVRTGVLGALTVTASSYASQYGGQGWGFAAGALGALLTYGSLQEFLNALAFSEGQRLRRRDIANPAPVHGSDALISQAQIDAWGLNQSDGLFVGMSADGKPVFFDPFARGHAHMCSVAPPAAGKSSSLVIPALLHWPNRRLRRRLDKPGSVVAIDIKGELTITTADHRARRMGQRVIILDAFGITGKRNTRWNPFQVLIVDLAAGGENLIELAVKFALIMIREPAKEGGDNAIFRNGGRSMVVACLLWLVVFDKQNCNPVGLRSLIFASRARLDTVVLDLTASGAFGGALKEYGNELQDLLRPESAKLFASFIRYAKDALALWSPAGKLAKSVTRSEFDMASVLDGKTTVYFALPSDRIEVASSYATLFTSSLFHTMTVAGKPTRLLMLADEAPYVLPNDTPIAMAQLRSLGLRIWQFQQSRRQTESRFDETFRRLVEELCSFLQFMRVADAEVAEDLSKASGTRTVTDFAHGQAFHDGQPILSSSFNKEQKPVLEISDVLHAPSWLSFIRITGRPILCTRLLPFWRVRNWRGKTARNPHEGDIPANEPPTVTIPD